MGTCFVIDIRYESLEATMRHRELFSRNDVKNPVG